MCKSLCSFPGTGLLTYIINHVDAGFKQDMIAMLGEFVGTTMFIFLGLGCVKTSQNSQTFTQSQTATTLSNQTILFISIGMGLSLLVTAWTFFRITGGLFNPAVTLALYLIGGIKAVRAILLTAAQIVGASFDDRCRNR